MLPALVTAAGGGWVTQMQSKYGVTAKHAADIWAGDVSDTDSQVYKTIGYYWHAPQDVDSHARPPNIDCIVYDIDYRVRDTGHKARNI